MDTRDPGTSAPKPTQAPTLPLPVRVLLAVFALPLLVVGVLLLIAAARDISAAPVAVIAIAIVQIVAGIAIGLAAVRGHSRFWGGESVSSILLPLIGALALVTAYDRSGQASRALGISEPAATALFLIIAGIAIFAAMVFAWRKGVSERGSRDAR
ncbi:MAG TPA: hypothetical protein VJ802_07485 [Gemmatimonadaceae bacterium]|nr:hypothetical protein [Gemmatimonadaceae bacterium]